MSQVVNNLDKDRLVPLLFQGGERGEPFEQEPVEREVAGGALGRTRAFIKPRTAATTAARFA